MPNTLHPICPHCQRRAPIPRGLRLCRSCDSALRADVDAAQERDALARWLASRVDAAGEPFADSALTATATDRRRIARMVRAARAAGLDWTRPPSAIHTTARYAAALAALLAPASGAA